MEDASFPWQIRLQESRRQPDGHMVTTIDTNFNYLEAIRDTTEVVCEAKVVRHGGRITVLTVEVFDDKGTLVCNGGFTYYNIVNQSSTMYGFEQLS